jgi:AraC-like DNA-binding protein
MHLSFHWINLLILFGALQAFIFSIILLFQKKHPGSKFLAAFTFALAYNGFETFNGVSGFDQYYYFFDVFSFIVIFGLGPSLYFYINTLLNPGNQPSRRIVLLHYSPFLLQLFMRISVIGYHLMQINGIIRSDVTSTRLFGILLMYSEALSIMLFVAYLSASILVFRKFTRAAIKSHIKDKRGAVIKWIKWLLICLSAVTLIWAVTLLFPELVAISSAPDYVVIELALVCFNYWLVIFGYHKVKSIQLQSDNDVRLSNFAEASGLLNKLIQAMEADKLYLDPGLNVSKMASHTGMAPKTISAILNQIHSTNFNDFVNDYRLREVTNRILDPQHQHLTISGIALDCGFNSQATFQRVFKNKIGMSPREYINTHFRKTA